MGNYRFRFSDMMPNAWFYKLKDMSKTKNKKNQHKKKHHENPQLPSRTSYSYYLNSNPIKPLDFYHSPVNRKASDTPFPDSSSRKLITSRTSHHYRRKTVYKPSPQRQESPDYFFSSSDDSFWQPGEFPESPLCFSEDPDDEASWPDSCDCEVSSNATDIIIDINKNDRFTQNVENLSEFDPFSEMGLPPILTKKPAKNRRKTGQVKNQSLSVKIFKEQNLKEHKTNPSPSPKARKSLSTSSGIKLRSNSPKLASKKIQAYARKGILSQRKSISESFIVVKSSFDPQKDFRDSMEEMIMENNIRNSKDMEDLLACYLSLNSKQYHDLIIKAFEQIWFDMTNLRL